MSKRLQALTPILAGAGALLILLALVVNWLAVPPEWLDSTLAIVGITLLALYPLSRPRAVLGTVRAQKTQASANAFLMSIIFIAIVGVVNYLGYRYHKRFDLTATGEFTLSPQTTQVLRDLKEPVHAVAFFTETDPRRQRAEDLLREYAQVTDKFTYEFVDLNREPGKARKYRVTRLGIVLLLRGDRREEVTIIDEEDLTSGIIKVTRDKPKIVYFVTGHGERDPLSFQDADYGQAVRAVEREFYEFRTLALSTITDTLPTDMDALVIADPRRPFSRDEIKRVFDYLNSGGRLLLMIDPSPDLDVGPLNEQLAAWGVRLRNVLVLDPQSSFFGDIASPLVTRYTFHTITKSLSGLATFFPTVRSIERLDPSPEHKQVTVLITSSPNSWGETEFTRSQVRYDEGKDTRGPLNLAVVVQDVGDKKGRLVVVGDADFPSNAIINTVGGTFGNVELFGNMINWLTEEEALVAIGPKPPAFHPLRPLTPGEQNLIFFTTTIFIPLLVLVSGLVVWWRRR